MLTFTLPELSENMSVFSKNRTPLPHDNQRSRGNLSQKESKFIRELFWPTNLSKLF